MSNKKKLQPKAVVFFIIHSLFSIIQFASQPVVILFVCLFSAIAFFYCLPYLRRVLRLATKPTKRFCGEGKTGEVIL
jgi:hypothetical protein